MATKDVLINFKCCICAKKNISQEAEKYCVECGDCFCLPCTELHRMFPSMTEHKLLDKAEFPTDRCSLHETRLLNRFCGKHDEIACDMCVSTNHSTCQDIHNIAQEIEELYKKSTLDEIKRQLTSALTIMKDMKKTKEHLLEELKEQKKKATDSVKKIRKEMEAVLEKLEEKSIKDIEAEYEKAEPKLLNEIKETETLIDKMEQSVDKMDNVGVNKAQEFVCVKTAEKNIVTAKDIENLLRGPKNVKITFLPDSEIQIFLQQLKRLGEVVHKSLYKVIKQKDIDVKLSNETNTCNIYGSCFTGDGSLLLADYINKKLKRVDMSTYSIKDHLDLVAQPNAVCQTSRTEAAVSLENNTIQFVSLGGKMATIRQLKMDHTCWGLACKDDKLFISDCIAAVYIHGMNGTMIHTVTADRSGNAIFNATRHISLSTSGDMVYVADCIKGLITLDIKGNYVSTFNDPDVVQPYAVCTDRRGNMFVSGLGNSNIVQINEESTTKAGVIDSVTDSSSACFDPKQNRLLVALFTPNTLKIYELE